MAIAALLLAAMFLFPIWAIRLEAPQYPEGIGINIRINNVEGRLPHDLGNINELNHYIGMKRITPESIPELKIMPFIVVFLIVTGLAIAVWGNRKWIMAWLSVFGVMAVVGLVDFYLWEYDYGHNLNSNAPIKVPGMTYQPPLLGSKQLLNINATSMPHIGFYIALLAIGIAGWVWWTEGKKSSPKTNLNWGGKVAA